jgi:hypothetical protein
MGHEEVECGGCFVPGLEIALDGVVRVNRVGPRGLDLLDPANLGDLPPAAPDQPMIVEPTKKSKSRTRGQRWL